MAIFIGIEACKTTASWTEALHNGQLMKTSCGYGGLPSASEPQKEIQMQQFIDFDLHCITLGG